jgi:hypothetical protein
VVDAGHDAGTSDAGTRDAGVSDAGTTDAGLEDAGPPPDGGFCTPCVSSADCLPNAFCRGGLTPRCSQDCASTGTCPGTASCENVNLGIGPLFGQTCNPDETSCGPYTVPSSLSCLDDWNGYARPFFATVCIGACHRHDGAWVAQADVQASTDAIRLSVETGTMPQNATLTPAERLRLLTWLACGAP